MTHDLSNAEAFTRVVGEHCSDKADKLLREITLWLVAAVHTPEDVSTVIDQALVVRIALPTFLKRRVTGIHYEEDDTQGKHINLMALVWKAFHDLRRHVTACAKPSVKMTTTVSAFAGSSKTKISNFYVEIVVQQNVFRLEIPMNHAL